MPAPVRGRWLTGTVFAITPLNDDAFLLFIMRFTILRTLAAAWLLVLLAFTAQAQADLGPVRSALRGGSAHDLAQYLAPAIEISFDGDKQNFNATQAELVLKDFFSKNAPTGFDFIHQGASNEGIQYAVGRYTSSVGTYRVYVKLKPSHGAPVIDNLDFTKE